MSKADELLSRYLYKKEDDKTLWAETIDYLNHKDKLVVGSKWVCDVEECLGGFYIHYKGEVCYVIKVFDDAVYIQHSINYEEDEMPTEQFLVCFKPLEKENV